MQPEFWLDAWKTGRRGFHRDDVHPDLVQHAHERLPAGGTVLVPLCGASHDLKWLAENGWTAIGVELSPIAAEELAERDGLTRADDLGPYARWVADGVTLLVGNFFDLTTEHIGQVDAIWDRAALVALRPDMRAEYLALERALLRPGGALLLNVLSYDQSLRDGPPWSIDPDFVASAWPEATRIEQRPEGVLDGIATGWLYAATVTGS
jgi:thiopurine S-methyltransferase